MLSLDRSFQPRQIVKNSQKSAQNWTRYETAFFSPDSQFLLLEQAINKNGSFSGGQLVFPTAGGAAVKTLVNVNQWVTRWVSSDLARETPDPSEQSMMAGTLPGGVACFLRSTLNQAP